MYACVKSQGHGGSHVGKRIDHSEDLSRYSWLPDGIPLRPASDWPFPIDVDDV